MSERGKEQSKNESATTHTEAGWRLLHTEHRKGDQGTNGVYGSTADIMYVRGIELVMISIHAVSLDVMGGSLRACVALQGHLNYSFRSAAFIKVV